MGLSDGARGSPFSVGRPPGHEDRQQRQGSWWVSTLEMHCRPAAAPAPSSPCGGRAFTLWSWALVRWVAEYETASPIDGGVQEARERMQRKLAEDSAVADKLRKEKEEEERKDKLDRLKNGPKARKSALGRDYSEPAPLAVPPCTGGWVAWSLSVCVCVCVTRGCGDGGVRSSAGQRQRERRRGEAHRAR